MTPYALCFGSGALACILAAIAFTLPSRARKGAGAPRARTPEGR
jgi:hypothetical protein